MGERNFSSSRRSSCWVVRACAVSARMAPRRFRGRRRARGSRAGRVRFAGSRERDNPLSHFPPNTRAANPRFAAPSVFRTAVPWPRLGVRYRGPRIWEGPMAWTAKPAASRPSTAVQEPAGELGLAPPRRHPSGTGASLPRTRKTQTPVRLEGAGNPRPIANARHHGHDPARRGSAGVGPSGAAHARAAGPKQSARYRPPAGIARAAGETRTATGPDGATVTANRAVLIPAHRSTIGP